MNAEVSRRCATRRNGEPRRTILDGRHRPVLCPPTQKGKPVRGTGKYAPSSARGESHGPAARGAGGSIPHKNPPFRPSGRIPVRDAKRRGRRDARSGREKRGHGKRGSPGDHRQSAGLCTIGPEASGSRTGLLIGFADPFVPIGARGVGPLARGFSARGAHRRPFDVADSPSGRNIQKSCWQQARAKRPDVGRPPGCRRTEGGRISFRMTPDIGLKTVSVPTKPVGNRNEQIHNKT